VTTRQRPVCDRPGHGEQREVELYVAVLGASNYTFAEVTFSQTVPTSTASTVRALEYFGASPKIVVPDQLRSAVDVPIAYDPDINQTLTIWLSTTNGRDSAPPRKPKARPRSKLAYRSRSGGSSRACATVHSSAW